MTMGPLSKEKISAKEFNCYLNHVLFIDKDSGYLYAVEIATGEKHLLYKRRATHINLAISQLNDHLWEGRYSPQVNGKRLARTVYAHSEDECEEKLAQLIREMKVEIAAEKEKFRTTEKAS